MTAPSADSLAAPPVASADPHAAPKLSPDDPRLALRRAGGRTLRTGPLVALLATLSGTVMLAVAFAFETPSKAPARGEATGPSAAPGAPVVPDAIRNAPARPAASLAHSESSKPPPVPPEADGQGRATSDEKVRQDQTLQAANAPILFASTRGGGEESAPPAAEPRMPPPPPNPALGRPSSPSEMDPNLQDRKNAFVEGQGSATATDHAAATLQHPRCLYEIQAGTVIPAVLITAINSDLPGPVVGQVRENVYDTVTGNSLLIPQGARLLANYDSMVAWGQERVLLCWNRLILPNGDSLDLQCMAAADLQGAAGLSDGVDEHWLRILKGAAVASLLAATTQGIAGNTSGFSPTVPQLWANGAAGDINQVGQQLTRRNLNIQPTITVRPGYSVNVMITRDLVIPPYVDGAPLPGLSR